MSYFKGEPIYIIVPTSEITEEMLNNTKMSFNSDLDSMRKTIAGVVPELTLFKMRAPVSEAFNGYAWYSIDTIRPIMATADWKKVISSGG